MLHQLLIKVWLFFFCFPIVVNALPVTTGDFKNPFRIIRVFVVVFFFKAKHTPTRSQILLIFFTRGCKFTPPPFFFLTDS